MPLFVGYAGWIEGVRDWLDVDEFTDAQIETFLYLAQTRLNRELESEFMEGFINIPVVTGGIPIPIAALIPDYNKVRLVSVPGGPALDALVINEMVNKINLELTDDVAWYCIDAQRLFVYPWAVDGSTIDFYYYKKIPHMTLAEPDTVFSTYHEDALLYAACVEASPYMDEDERAGTFATMLVSIIETTNAVAKKATHGSAPLRRQIKGLS